MMIKPIITSIFFLLSLCFMSHLKGQTLPNEQAEVIKNHVDNIFHEMVTIAENMDFDELSSGVDDTHGAGFIANNKYFKDYTTLINDVKTNAQGLSHQDISVKEKKITVLSDKIVLLTASGVSSAQINDGRVIKANFQWSFIYEKIDDNWKVIYSHQSIAN